MSSILDQVTELRDRGALFVVNHSGGKDSQALRIKVQELVPDDQILVVHADLPGAEWAKTFEHVQYDCKGLEIVKVTAVKTFEQMVLRRGFWPSPSYRQCTSDLKRGPIERDIRHWLKANNHSGLVVNCMGLRAEESAQRSKATAFKFNNRNSKAGREWYDWLPIHDMLETEVFANIAADGKVVHEAYEKGMRRLSCVFCIMACGKDLKTAATENPRMFSRYVAMEKVIDQTFIMPSKTYGKRNLEEVVGLTADAAQVAADVVELTALRISQPKAA